MSNLLSSEPVKESGSYKCTAKGHVDDYRRSGRRHRIDGGGGNVPCQHQICCRFAQNRQLVKISHQGIKYHVEQQTADRGRHNKAEHMPLVRTLIDSANLVGHQTGYQTDTQLQQEGFGAYTT